MHFLRRLVPLLIGFGSTYVSLVLIRGFMASRLVPIEYFKLFSKENSGIALFLMNLVKYMVPETLVLVGGAVMTSRLLLPSRGFNLVMFTAGAAACYFSWLVFYRTLVLHSTLGDVPVSLS